MERVGLHEEASQHWHVKRNKIADWLLPPRGVVRWKVRILVKSIRIILFLEIRFLISIIFWSFGEMAVPLDCLSRDASSILARTVLNERYISCWG